MDVSIGLVVGHEKGSVEVPPFQVRILSKHCFGSLKFLLPLCSVSCVRNYISVMSLNGVLEVVLMSVL